MVRRAAGIAPGQMDQVTQWVEDAAIRWGHDAATRETWHGAPAFAENSWRTGLDRLLAGYATGRVDALVNGVSPLAGDLVGDTDLLGAFVQWVETLMEWVGVLRAERPLAQWTEQLLRVLDWLVLAEDADERATIDRVRRDLERLAAPNGIDTGEQPVSFDVVRDWVTEALADDEQASGFLTGGLTLCAMKPMRAIPHRIIVMLGLDDRAYPRRLRRAAFDLIGMHPISGDRDPRADDRQLVLDTLMSAGDRLLLSYVGRSQANNSEIAPSIVITELLDTVDRLYPASPAPSKQLRVEHPLQPFSPRYFTAGAGGNASLFSYDDRLARSVAGSVHRTSAPPFFDGDVPVLTLERDLRPGRVVSVTPRLDVTIDDLMETWLNPSKVYCRRVLQLIVAGDEAPTDDVEPMAVHAMQRTVVQQRMVQRALEGHRDVSRERALAIASGELPVAALGANWYDVLRTEAASLIARVEGTTFADPLPVEIEGLDWIVRGHLPLQLADEQWRVRAGNLKPRDKARAWIAHVVRCAAGSPVATRVIARDMELVIPPITDAPAQLDLLVQGVRAAWSAPLPYFLEAASVYRKKVLKGDDSALESARDEYQRESNDYGPGGDLCDPYVHLLWRGRDPIREFAEQFVALADGFWRRFDEVTGS
jgi:exodeoxyribonuclease V gamma subunit